MTRRLAPAAMAISLVMASGAVPGQALASAAGKLYAFGDNNYGELGIATNAGTGNPNPRPALVSLPGATGPVVQVAAGGYHSLALTSTGQLYAFGYNVDGTSAPATRTRHRHWWGCRAM